jgi:trigger factor
MQVTETLAEGLKRSYKVIVPITDLDTRVSARLDDMKNTARINGFRPGKVPVGHLRRLYGRSVLAEAIEETVQQANQKIVADNGFRLAMQPKIALPEDQTEIAAVFDGKRDLAWTVDMEILPTVPVTDPAAIKVEMPVSDVTEDDVAAALKRIADQNQPFEPKAEGATAADGDQVTISFVGRVDGVAFEGGTADDVPLVLGSNSFIPGFEAGLVGTSVGESREVAVTFPEGYGAKELAGKPAVFSVTVKAIAAPGAVIVDDKFAESLGMENLEKLRSAVTDQLARENAAVSRQRVKRQVLDQLDGQIQMDLPSGLVDQEFDGIWRTVTEDLARASKTFADENTTEEAARADYRKIAERRVRLGLTLAEIGEKNGVKVTDEEVGRALVERARQFPGQEQQVWDYYRKNPDAMASLRAPIFEEKVVDYLLGLATVTEKKVTRAELMTNPESDAA